MKVWLKDWRVWAGIAFAVVVVAYVSFRAADDEDATPKPVIAVILPSADNPFWIEVRRGAERARDALIGRYDVRVVPSAELDPSSQMEIMDSFLTRNKVSALVLGPASDVTVVPAVGRYSANNIPVVVIDTELDSLALSQAGGKVDAFIGSDNVSGGRLAGNLMVSELRGKGKALVIHGSFVHQSAIDRTKGFLEVAEQNGLTVESVDGEWRRATAQEITRDRFSRGRVDGVFANNDDMALGVIAALKSLDIPQDKFPVVIGFDATVDGLAAAQAGTMYKTIQQNAAEMGYEGVIAAKMIIEDEPGLQRHRLLPCRAVPE